MSSANLQSISPRTTPATTGRGEDVMARSAGETSPSAEAGQLRVLIVTSSYPTPQTPRATPFIKRQVDALQNAGLDVEVFHFRGAKNPLNYLLAWRRFRRRITSGAFDLVHAQFGQSGLLALPKRVPLVVTMRGSDLLGVVHDAKGHYTLHGRLLQRACRAVARRADAVILVADHMRSQIGDAVPCEVIPSGIDFELFRCLDQHEARRQLGLPLERRLVLFVGDPNRARKRFSLAKAAMQELNRTIDAELIVAWRRTADEIPLFMNACDALVFTSMQEGPPNVVKEALACNLPVVSVDVGDVADRLAGVAGCVLTADNPQAIAAALAEVLASGQRTASRATVAELDERLLTQRVIAVYRRAMESYHARKRTSEHA